LPTQITFVRCLRWNNAASQLRVAVVSWGGRVRPARGEGRPFLEMQISNEHRFVIRTEQRAE